MTLRAPPQSCIKTFDLKTEILRLFSDSAIARQRTANIYKSPCCTSLACWGKAAVLGKTDLCGVTKGTDTSARLVTTHPSRVFVPQWHLDFVPFQKMRRSNEDPLLVGRDLQDKKTNRFHSVYFLFRHLLQTHSPAHIIKKRGRVFDPIDGRG